MRDNGALGSLVGLRVVDLSRVLAGPFCAMMLGDHGADVIKVESPSYDDTRQWGPPFAGADVEDAPTGYRGESAYYLFCNRNKRGIVIDLSKEAGQAVALRLIDGADVVIENFRPGTLEKWGLGYEDNLSVRNPRLIFASISGFGADGPYSQLPGYDVLAQAMSGIMSITGEPGRGPQRVGVAIADLLCGLYLMSGILMAVAARQASGRGQRVDASVFESMVSVLTHMASNYLIGGIRPQQYGNAHPSIVPYRLFRTADSHVYVAVGNDRQFALLSAEIGMPQLAQDPRYRTNPDRATNRATLEPTLEAVFASQSTDEWVRRLWKAGVPASPVASVEDVLANPQVLHRQMLVRADHPTIAAGVPMLGIPVKLGDTPGAIRRHPPLPGEHTREVLREIGLSASEVQRLESTGVVRSWPSPPERSSRGDGSSPTPA